MTPVETSTCKECGKVTPGRETLCEECRTLIEHNDAELNREKEEQDAG